MRLFYRYQLMWLTLLIKWRQIKSAAALAGGFHKCFTETALKSVARG